MNEHARLLDSPAVSGRYLFPQPRSTGEPFFVRVDDVELACQRRLFDPDWRTLVHFHGNGEAAADYLPWMADRLAELRLNSLFVEYREYGRSTGKARLAQMRGDGQAVLAAAGLPPPRCIVFGRSIGSLYAVELVSREPRCAGLVLESGIADPAERFLRYADLEATGATAEALIGAARACFDQQKKLAAYFGPLLVLHAERDGLVDVSHAERNFRWAAGTNKRLIRFRSGDHNSILPANESAYFGALRDFVESLDRADETPPRPAADLGSSV